MTDPTPDIDGYADHRVSVPDEHTALRLLRDVVEHIGCDVVAKRLAMPGQARFFGVDLTPAQLDLLHRLTQQENTDG